MFIIERVQSLCEFVAERYNLHNIVCICVRTKVSIESRPGMYGNFLHVGSFEMTLMTWILQYRCKKKMAIFFRTHAQKN